MKEEEFRDLCQSTSLDLEKIQLLIQFGIDVDGKDNDGMNALHFLCLNNSSEKLIDAIKLLIQLRINVSTYQDFGLFARPKIPGLGRAQVTSHFDIYLSQNAKFIVFDSSILNV